MERQPVLDWIDRYERAWRAEGTGTLPGLFTEDATYLQSPYEAPKVGLREIAVMWDDERSGPDEQFTMSRELVAVDGDTAVARVLVRYGDPLRQEYLDLWVIRFASDGRVERFEEWPYWPDRGYTPS